MKKRIKLFEQFVNEGIFSELDIIGQESETKEEFMRDAKAYLKQHAHNPRVADDDDFLEKLASSYFGESKGTNYEITVTENATDGRTGSFVVSAEDYEQIEELYDAPGFKVYSVDLYTDDSSKQLSDREEVKDFLKSLNPHCLLETKSHR